MNKPVLILAQSYPHVKNVLYLIDQHSRDAVEIRVLVFQNKYLFDFLIEMNNDHFNNDIKISYVPKYSGGDDNKFIKYNLLAEKIFLRKQFNKFCHQARGHQIYFFSKSFTDYGYYFLRRLHKDNKVIHIQDPGCDVYTIKDGKPKSLKSLIKIIYAKILYGRNIIYGDTGKKRVNQFYTISDNYYNKIVEKSILKEERDEIQENFSLSKYSIKKYNDLKVIYFDKDVVKDGLCEDSQFQNEVEAIFNVITEYFPSEKIGKKYKPNRTTDYNKNRINVGKIISDFVPAELLYNDNVEIYLGMTSMALANIEKGNVISLIYLITFLNPEYREGSVQNQENRKKGKKIYYPKTLDQLRTLLSLFLQ